MGTSRCRVAGAAVVCVAIAVGGVVPVLAEEPIGKRSSALPVERVEAAHLPNAVRVTPRVFTGGLPDGAAGFEELRALGVKTVVSVDGVKPDVAGAKAQGLRYVHLPHGYAGVPEERVREIAKLVREFPGGVYIHCHHGKHRAPAATAAGCVAAGLISTESARDVLKVAGTGKNYRGLFATVERARALDPATLDEIEADFPETAELPALTEAMVELDEVFARVKAMTAASGTEAADAAHQSLLLREQFAELMRMEEVQAQPEEFRGLLRESEGAAVRLEQALAQRDERAVEAKELAREIDLIAVKCAECHRRFRDVRQ